MNVKLLAPTGADIENSNMWSSHFKQKKGSGVPFYPKKTDWMYPITKQRLPTMDPEWKRLERERRTLMNQDVISKHKIGKPPINNPIGIED